MTSSLDWSMGAVEMAQAVLGHRLVFDGCEGEIVETEAYPGDADRASHSHLNRETRRNRSMFLAGGSVYVYFIYGMHHCLNLVSGSEGHGEAVLIRALRPLSGLDRMRARRGDVGPGDLCRGPARLCKALGIDLALDGVRVGAETGLRIEPPIQSPLRISKGPRIGVEYAGSWAKRHFRYACGDSSFWSRPFPGQKKFSR